MSANELKQAVLLENEAAFSLKGDDYLLYGWEQCDGYVLSLECEGELVWQSAPRAKGRCIEEFLTCYAQMI